jgi:ferric-dicitrate binding protein FerR (iron transport regulator)
MPVIDFSQAAAPAATPPPEAFRRWCSADRQPSKAYARLERACSDLADADAVRRNDGRWEPAAKRIPPDLLLLEHMFAPGLA